ncbi:hypothetical protein [Tepidiforma sp.]|uniref:hypothetical protein n=1 Tax=Tepidiforma sp. TaxID=2682230 RepID=UPI002613F804|nr:hypothetical protein [Tepidiforma sp.]MCX7616795.1 hypothetical protein [Tepidiforma sp.]
MTAIHHGKRWKSRQAQPATGRLGRLILFVTGLVGVLALGPIAWGIVTGAGAGSGAASAFASAPPGTYAVVGRTEGSVDIIGVVRADQPDNVIEVARVPHIDGFTTTGSVDDRGRYVALAAVDGGTPLAPAASLVLVDLERGTAERLLAGIEPSQTPLWKADSSGVIVTRARQDGDRQVIDVLEVALDGAVRLRWTQDALGVYPVGWREGRVLSVAIDARGSTLQAEGQDVARLSSGFTRDWALSPDGRALAFIEVTPGTEAGYTPRVVRLDGEATGSTQALTASGAATLGAAWGPNGVPAFGAVPRAAGAAAPSGDASAQALRAAGFDVPLAYSPDGEALAVVHWDGTGFEAPGTPTLQLVRGSERAEIPGYRGFYGWVRR